jgi:outer membrane protein assembly factor BamD
VSGPFAPKGAALLLVAGVLSGCGGKPRQPGPVMLGADSVYQTAMRQYRRGDCTHAKENLGLVLTNPGSDALAAEASYYQAECDYADGQYLEAAREFRRVADEHAGHPLAPDALLRAGDAQAELWQDPELDPEYGQAAMATYRELTARFPDSRAAARAAAKLVRLADMFADKDYRSGRFYQRLKAYDSAILYFRGVVADYPQSRYAPQALVRLVQIYRLLNYADERKETCDHLHRYYPQTAGLSQACPAPADSASGR